MISIDKNKIPFFSVVIASYNRSAKLVRALDSLLNQNFDDWECIIADDGSDDGTFNLVKTYCDNDKRFRYLYHSNRKQAMTKNAGILASSGYFVTFLDSDDEYESSHLYLRYKLLTQNPDVELLHGGVRIIGNEYVPDINNPSKKIHLNKCVIGGSFFICKDAALKFGGFDDVEYGDDNVFYNKAVKHGLVVGKTEYPTYIYHRDSEDSLCNIRLV
ncbi:MAG: glycosyltransferase family 2 protein [Candidatus Kapaibacterium sp.]